VKQGIVLFLLGLVLGVGGVTAVFVTTDLFQRPSAAAGIPAAEHADSLALPLADGAELALSEADSLADVSGLAADSAGAGTPAFRDSASLGALDRVSGAGPTAAAAPGAAPANGEIGAAGRDNEPSSGSESTAPADSGAVTVPGAQAARMIRLLGTMKPAEAARIIEQLTDDEAAAILAHLPERKAGQLMASLNPQRAAAISRLALQNERSRQ
jgi:hypothetical protein